MSDDPYDPLKIIEKCQHFRILVVGRANAGKTTLLQKVCQSKEDPLIFDPDGNELDLSVVAPSDKRGIHDIDNQMIFKSSSQFIFHDSAGFEAGSEDEIETMTNFIRTRGETSELKYQLHAIWYCLSTESNRPILRADELFFERFGSGKVPIVAIFTKFDALIKKEYQNLRNEGISHEDATSTSRTAAVNNLEDDHISRLLALTNRSGHMKHVVLEDMHKDHTKVDALLERTLESLDNTALRLLFVSVQQNNVNLCIKGALEYSFERRLRELRKSNFVMNWVNNHIPAIKAKTEDEKQTVRDLLIWFPTTFMKEDYSKKVDQDRRLRRGPLDPLRWLDDELTRTVITVCDNLDSQTVSLLGSRSEEARYCFTAAILICAESSALTDGETQFSDRFLAAQKRYVALDQFKSIKHAVRRDVVPLTRKIDLKSPDSRNIICEKMFEVIQNHCLPPNSNE